MRSGVYYNDRDAFVAEWLRALIRAGVLPDGEVDERDIETVDAADLRGFRACHFFAGIGGWPYALALAGWPDDRFVFTGSCPCQPYSRAPVGVGGAEGQRDARHLWPIWFRLIRECRPHTIFSEQVGTAIAWGWLDEVGMDLETEGYAVAAVVLRAHPFGAVHERKRLYLVAEPGGAGLSRLEYNGRVPVTSPTPIAVARDPLDRARRVLAGDLRDLLPRDGLSLEVERDALRGYGNAVIPQVAAAFVRAYLDR